VYTTDPFTPVIAPTVSVTVAPTYEAVVDENVPLIPNDAVTAPTG
jgi:hypothetical protein